MGELATSIAHEVNQPLAAIVSNAEAGLRFNAKAPKARGAQSLSYRPGRETSERGNSHTVILRKDSQQMAPLDISGGPRAVALVRTRC